MKCKQTGIYVAYKENKVFIKLCGSIKYTSVKGFDSFVSGLIKKNEIEDVLLDLSETESIDSTNFGIIAKLGIFMLNNRSVKATILSTADDINKLLESMGFEQIFNILRTDHIDNISFSDMPGIDKEEVENASVLLESHKTLMSMNEKNKKTFKNVVEFLEKDMLK